MPRTIVVASAERYRRPPIAGLEMFEGAGARDRARRFSRTVSRRFHIVARRPLEDTMSRYLIDLIPALPNVESHVGSEIIGLEGDAEHGLDVTALSPTANGSTVA